LPFLFERRPHEYARGHPYLSIDAPSSLRAYEQAVAETRAWAEWLLARTDRPSVGSPALVGVSLGAFIAVITCAMDPRIRRLVTVFGGGDLDTVVSRGIYGLRVTRELKRRGITSEDRRRARAEYDAYLRRVRQAVHPLEVEPAFQYFLFDPLTYAHQLRHTPTLMINAALDPIVPRLSALRLRAALDGAESCLLWGTHWTGGPWRFYVARRIDRFLSTPDEARP
ncbi:MAG: hypothetical protein JXB46_10920, partial [Candidatus Eisenbacteria bacterium]|nr:hypothetical protein [Candidatus Eisenbacteria bacterium]